MTYEAMVRKLRNYGATVDASCIKEHIAVQINVHGECEGALYVEIVDGRINVQPYEYFDRDALFYVDAGTMKEILEGRLTYREAYERQQLVVQGNHDTVTIFNELAYQRLSDGAEPKCMKLRRRLRRSERQHARQRKQKRKSR